MFGRPASLTISAPVRSAATPLIDAKRRRIPFACPLSAATSARTSSATASLDRPRFPWTITLKVASGSFWAACSKVVGTKACGGESALAGSGARNAGAQTTAATAQRPKAHRTPQLGCHAIGRSPRPGLTRKPRPSHRRSQGVSTVSRRMAIGRSAHLAGPQVPSVIANPGDHLLVARGAGDIAVLPHAPISQPLGE